MRDDDDQALVAEGLARWLHGSGESSPAGLRRELGAGGWIWPAGDELLLPRAHLVVAVGQALGRAAAPVPWSTMVGTAAMLQRLEVPDGPRCLDSLAAGEAPVAVAPSAAPGRPSLVIDAAEDRPLLVVRQGAIVWVPAGAAALQPLHTLDGHAAAWVDTGAVGGRVLAQGEAAHASLQAATDWALLASCAHVGGLLQRLVEQTVAYVGTRRQFGAAIASFQAVQHRAVDMHVAAQELRALLHATADQLEAPDGSLAVARLKVKCARSARLVAQGAVQLHGAMGLTDELPIGRAVLAVEAELARHASAGACAARLQQALLREPA